jgi:thioredoxin 1
MEEITFIQIVAGLLLGGACGVLLSSLGRCVSASGSCLFTGNPRRGGLLGAATGAVMAFVLAFAPAGSQAADPGNESSYRVVPITTENDFSQLVLHARRPVVVNFYSDSCPPCQQLLPTIEKIAQDYQNRVVIYNVRIEDLPSLVVLYRIRAVPTAMFFRDGREAERVIGAQERNEYIRALERLLITNRTV